MTDRDAWRGFSGTAWRQTIDVGDHELIVGLQTSAPLRSRRSHIITGLPDAYGRGRIIGDYRRVALYGVDRLIEERRERRSALDAKLSAEVVIRDREELAEQIRALEDLRRYRDRLLRVGHAGGQGHAVLRRPGEPRPRRCCTRSTAAATR